MFLTLIGFSHRQDSLKIVSSSSNSPEIESSRNLNLSITRASKGALPLCWASNSLRTLGSISGPEFGNFRVLRSDKERGKITVINEGIKIGES